MSRPDFRLAHVWQVGVAAVTVQLAVNLFLLHKEFDKRLAFGSEGTPAEPTEDSILVPPLE